MDIILGILIGFGLCLAALVAAGWHAKQKPAGKTAATQPRAATARPRAKKANGVSAEERRRLIAEAGSCTSQSSCSFTPWASRGRN